MSLLCDAGACGSAFAEVAGFDDLHDAGIEIENASGIENQIELQPERKRLEGIGRPRFL